MMRIAFLRRRGDADDRPDEEAERNPAIEDSSAYVARLERLLDERPEVAEPAALAAPAAPASPARRSRRRTRKS